MGEKQEECSWLAMMIDKPLNSSGDQLLGHLLSQSVADLAGLIGKGPLRRPQGRE